MLQNPLTPCKPLGGGKQCPICADHVWPPPLAEFNPRTKAGDPEDNPAPTVGSSLGAFKAEVLRN